ncbi:MAG: cation:proton antiporter [Silvibacterium sp.]|nr:cation:proton antiporter [Silvibacterium sp.]MBV8438891.1 cation:proton antiporter [Silvibacterium sp.]
MLPAESHHEARLFVEIGASVIVLSILARFASRWGFSAIPLYLLVGLAFGNGGLLPLHLSQSFIGTGAQIGVLLLLFMLGLEYHGEDLVRDLRSGLPAGGADFLLNFTPGLAAGLLMKWSPLAAVLLGGITYISSSGIVAKVLSELNRVNNPETPTVLAVLVLEDLAMAVYLPLVGVSLAGGTPLKIATSVGVAVTVVILVLILALRLGHRLSSWVSHESEEIVLLTTFGLVLFVAGIAARFKVSAEIGAFLVGIALSGQIAEQTHRLLSPLRDLFAAIFFFFFGLQIDPRTLPPALPLAILLGVVTALTKVLTGYWSANRAHIDRHGCIRAGAALIARGEFSIVIAGLGAAIEPKLGPLAAAYVLFLAIIGPMVARLAK